MPDQKVYTQFKKGELLEIAKELDLNLAVSVRSKEIVEAVFADFKENGLPEPDSVSDMLFEFLVSAEFIDENGNVLSDEQGEEGAIDDADLPVCFSFADERDPSCKECRVLVLCGKERIKNRPPCYGKLYLATDEQCKACIEALPCSQIVNQNKS